MAIPLKDDQGARRFPLVTYSLAAANIAVYALSPISGLVGRGPRLPGALAGGSAPALVDAAAHTPARCTQQAFLAQFGAIPRELITGHQVPADLLAGLSGCAVGHYDKVGWMSVLTAMFIHGSLLHLIGNMLFLLVFGRGVEDRLGRLPFLAAYLGFGYAATYAFAFTDPGSVTPLVGASGAIAGILGTYFVLTPWARVLTLILIIPARLPAWVLLGVWFAQQWYALRSGDPEAGVEGGVAYLAHIYGFAFGVVLGLRLRIQRIRHPVPDPPATG